MTEISRLQNVGIFSCLFTTVLFFGFAVEGGRGNLKGDALAASISLLVFCSLCVPGLCFLTNGNTLSVRRIGLWIVVLAVFAQHLMLVILSFVEWADPDCERDVLAVCTAQRENFLAVVAVVTLLHLGYLLFWRTRYLYWKSPQLPKQPEPTGRGGWPSDHMPFFSDTATEGGVRGEGDDDGDSSVSSAESLVAGGSDLIKNL